MAGRRSLLKNWRRRRELGSTAMAAGARCSLEAASQFVGHRAVPRSPIARESGVRTNRLEDYFWPTSMAAARTSCEITAQASMRLMPDDSKMFSMLRRPSTISVMVRILSRA